MDESDLPVRMGQGDETAQAKQEADTAPDFRGKGVGQWCGEGPASRSSGSRAAVSYEEGFVRILLCCLVMMVSLEAAADERVCGPPRRNAEGKIVRKASVLRQFETIHPRPDDGQRWILDHVIPLACGGCDSIENLQWLPESAWRLKSKWERVVYGGNGISQGCP